MRLLFDVIAVVGFVLVLIALAIIGFFAGVILGGIAGTIAIPAYGYRIIRTYSSPKAEGEEVV
jgi:hypothetical protein